MFYGSNMERAKLGLFSILPLISLYGCDISPKDDTLTTSGGVVNKGILSQAVANAYKAGTSDQVKQVYTNADGTFSLEDVNHEGSIYVEVRTTSQTLATCDSANGCGNFTNNLKLAGEKDSNLNGQIDFGDKYFFNDAEFLLTAFIQSAQSNSGRFAVTPLTHLAAQKIKDTGDISPDTIDLVNAQVAELFGLDGTDISRVIPPDITSESQMQGASPAQRMYAALNAAVASAADADTSVADVITLLATDFVEQGGLVANSSDPNKVTLASLQQLADDVADVVEQALPNIDMDVVQVQIQNEVTEQLAQTPDSIVLPSVNPVQTADFDKDGIPDDEEANHGTDPNDADSDDDGLLDGQEITLGTNALNADTDNDTMFDGWEVAFSLDPLNPDDANEDGDGDGLINSREFAFNSRPDAEDTDGDGLKDGDEVDSYGTNPTSADSDGDGLTDSDELMVHGTNPLNSDSDSDGLNDFAELNVNSTDPLDADSDNDTMTDGWEVLNNLDPLDAADATTDADGDGVSNQVEFANNTDPNNSDTDGDGADDSEELAFGLNPLVDDANTDLDGDTIIIIDEFRNGSDPNVPNPVIEFVSDAQIYTQTTAGNLTMIVSSDESVITVAQDTVTDLNMGGLDSNGVRDVIEHNLVTNTYDIPVRDQANATNLLNGASNIVDISADGLKVLFSSAATNVIAGDSNASEDLFVYDRITKTSERLGTNALLNNNSYFGYFQGDGQKVFMESYSSTLVSPDSNGYGDVFKYDLGTDTPTLISEYYLGGDSANEQSNIGDISADGNRMVFTSRANNIVDATGGTDSGSLIDVYLYEASSDTYKRVSTLVDAAEDDTGADAGWARISANGKAIIYQTPKDMLDLNVAGVGAGFNQIFYVDVDKLLAGDTTAQHTTLVSKSHDGSNNGYGDNDSDGYNLYVTADGQHVIYTSKAQNLLVEDASAASIDDVYIWDKATESNHLVSQYVFGRDSSNALIYDSSPVSHTNGMGLGDYALNLDGSHIYALLDYGHEYTDAPATCAVAATYCLYKIRLALPSNDQDGDGLNDVAEIAAFTILNDSDTDNDGLSDGDEVLVHNTSPINPNTDGDPRTDSEEIADGTDPLDATDFNTP